MGWWFGQLESLPGQFVLVCVDPLTGYNRDFVKNIDLEKSKQGQVCLKQCYHVHLIHTYTQVLVDDWLRVVGADNVYALGDCASPISGHLPCTAQVNHSSYNAICVSLFVSGS